VLCAMTRNSILQYRGPRPRATTHQDYRGAVITEQHHHTCIVDFAVSRPRRPIGVILKIIRRVTYTLITKLIIWMDGIH
jgi:hypothetical protein